MSRRNLRIPPIIDQEGNVYLPPRYMDGQPVDLARIRRKVRRAALNHGCIIKHELEDEKFGSKWAQIAFIDECANAIHLYMKDRDGAADILKIAQEENAARLEKVEGAIKIIGGFTLKAIAEAMEILKRDLERPLEKARKESWEVNYDWGFDQKRHPWKERTKDLIRAVREIYIKYSPLKNPYQIAHSMSLVFQALRISPSGADTIRKYFRQSAKTEK